MDFSVSPGDGEATLQWADPQDADIDRYEVRHGPSVTALGQWLGIPESGASTVRHTVTGLANGERHHFELRAVTEVGSGEAAYTSIRLAVRPDAVVEIPDSGLRDRVAWILKVPADSNITQGQMATLKIFGPGGPGLRIVDLTGIEYAVNLTEFRHSGDVSDLTPLADLTTLTVLQLGRQVSDLSPLAGLTALRTLGLSYNKVSDLSPLAALTNLTELYLDGNRNSWHGQWTVGITDLSPLAGLTALRTLVVGYNAISDLTPLAGLNCFDEP